MIRIYFAAPLFNQAELRFNEYLGNLLKKAGFDVFLPQENEEKPDAENVSQEDLKKIYLGDIHAVDTADIVVAVADGADMDSGTAFEVGYATAKGKPVYVLRTDIRMQNKSELVNLMIQEAAAEIYTNVDDLVSNLKKKYE